MLSAYWNHFGAGKMGPLNYQSSKRERGKEIWKGKGWRKGEREGGRKRSLSMDKAVHKVGRR